MAVFKIRSLLFIALLLMMLALLSGYYMKERLEKYTQKGIFVFSAKCGDDNGYLY